MSPVSPPSNSHASLRIASFNVGCGFLRKLPDITARCHSLALDIVALQEIGDPALLQPRLAEYTLVVSAGPSNHEAGVGLLLSHDLAPHCRAFKRSDSGRLVGVIVEMSKGHRILFACAYMPSGLDHASPSSPAIQLAHQLYIELISWSIDATQVIIMGDLNETLTSHDRYSFRQPLAVRNAVSASSPIQCLVQEGFTDVYRHLHTDAACTPGYTHHIDSPLIANRSRIDYIWTKGFAASALLHIHIDNKLHRLSHHQLLWMELRLHPLHHSKPMQSELAAATSLPNLRRATSQHEKAFIERLNTHLQRDEHQLTALSLSDDVSSLDTCARYITSAVRKCAFSAFPLTGTAPKQTKSILRLQRQRQELTRLHHIAVTLHSAGAVFIKSPEWQRLHRVCSIQYNVRWRTDVYNRHDTSKWMHETTNLIHHTRALIRQEVARCKRTSRSHFEASPTATVHQMLQSNGPPSQLLSVIDSHGDLTSTGDDLKRVLSDHFESVFAMPPADTTSLPYAPPSMLFDKLSINAQWFEGLMADISPSELLQTIRDAPRVSSPGEDKVAVGVWKIALQHNPLTLRLVANLFSSCLRSECFPQAWKSSVIVPFIKDGNKERTMSNIRPISLQSCLGKLLNKTLAHRLGSILARFPILNESQRGFVTGGTTIKCIDELLDAWDSSRKNKSEQYTLLYDIKQAYDSVQSSVLVRALHRIRLPQSFVALIHDSLTDLTSCVQTAYGVTRAFAVRRSLRQGDPLAPLLFVILMDALHDGLETHPQTHLQHGCKISIGNRSIYLASLGYADDTAVITNSLPSLFHQNEWVQYFMKFNSMRLNSQKCELVGRGPDGLPVQIAALQHHNITVDGAHLIPKAHNCPIRYLGVHACFDGSWATQQRKSQEMIMIFTRAIAKFKVPLRQAVYMFNVFLLPKLELSLHYVHGPNTTKWLKDCDRLMIGSIKHLVQSPLMLSHSAVALSLSLNLPSWLEVSIKVSELFLRINASNCRWGGLGRLMMQKQHPALIDSHTVLPRLDSSSSTIVSRSVHLAASRLLWQLQSNLQQRDHRSRFRHLFDADILGRPTDSASCTSTLHVALPHGATASIAHDVWSGWVEASSPRTLHIYTDGSFDQASSSSSWSVVIGDAWFDDNHNSIPADESLITASHIGGSTMIGAAIDCTSGVYPAELQAIARSLAMTSASLDLHIHSDSRSSIEAIYAYEHQINERHRLRMAARPLLQLIHHLLSLRHAAGGSVIFSHVKAHSTNTDAHSTGNRLADYQANRARVRSDRSFPLTLSELPLSKCEHYLTLRQSDGLQVIDDVRTCATSHVRSQAMIKWTSHNRSTNDQGYFAGIGMLTLGKVMLSHGSASQQATFVHIATNSIHYHWATQPDGSSQLQQIQCHRCDEDLTLHHFASCKSSVCTSSRDSIRDVFCSKLTQFDEAKDWLRLNRQQPLGHIISALFPFNPSLLSASSSAPVVDRDHHIARIMIGAFTPSESVQASKSLGFASAASGRHAMHQLRIASVEQIGIFFTQRKA